jgi:hypothetical protein
MLDLTARTRDAVAIGKLLVKVANLRQQYQLVKMLAATPHKALCCGHWYLSWL